MQWDDKNCVKKCVYSVLIMHLTVPLGDDFSYQGCQKMASEVQWKITGQECHCELNGMTKMSDVGLLQMMNDNEHYDQQNWSCCKRRDATG